MNDLWIDQDGNGDPTLWRPGVHGKPVALCRRCDCGDEAWAILEAAVAAGVTAGVPDPTQGRSDGRGRMKLAYADPPYFGCCKLYDHEHGDEGRCWDDIDTHARLLARLDSEFDGWAYSLTAPSLAFILPLAREHGALRVAAWVKPFAAFKRNVRIAYTWEPVLFKPGRDSSTDGAPVGRDHLAAPITMRRGFTGAKPAKFNRWVLDLMGYVEGDEVTDLYPGTHGMADTLRAAVLL